MARRHSVKIEITAANKARGVIDSVVGSLGRLGDASAASARRVGGLGLALVTGVGAGVAMAAVGGIVKITQAIGGMGAQALHSVSNIQALEMSLEALVAEKAMYQEVNTQRQVTTRLTKGEREELEKLILKRNVHNARMQEQSQRVWEMTNRWTQQGLATKTAEARLAEMQSTAEGMSARIAELSAKEGRLVTVTDTRIKQVMTYEEAMAQAKVETRELMDAIAEIAIVSPFETKDVERIAQMGLMANMSTDRIKDFTAAYLDYAAAHGIAGPMVAFGADQFLQLAKIGKITTIDMRQLRRIGIDVSRILGVDLGENVKELTDRFGDLDKTALGVFSGMTVEEFNKAVERSPELMDVLFQKFTLYSEQTAAGASERMATTVMGMMSTLGDIVELGSRYLFRPMVEAVSPALSDMLSRLADVVTGPKVKALGENLGERIAAGMAALSEGGQAQAITGFFKSMYDAIRSGAGFLGTLQSMLVTLVPSRLIKNVMAFTKSLRRLRDATKAVVKLAVETFREAFERFVGEGQTASGIIETVLVKAMDVATLAFDALADALEWVATNWETVKDIAVVFGGFLAGRAVLGAIIKITQLLSPFGGALGMIGIAVGLLKTAWENNWLGIQDVLSNVMEKIGPAIDTISGFISNLISGLSAGEGKLALEEMVAGFASALEGLGIPEEIITRFTRLGDAVAPLSEGIQDLVSGDAGGALSGFALGIGEVAEAMLGLEEGRAAGIAESITTMATGIGTFAEKAASVAVNLTETVWETAFGWFKDHGDAVSEKLLSMGSSAGSIARSFGRFLTLINVDAGAANDVLSTLVEGGLNAFYEILAVLEPVLKATADALERFVGWLAWLSTEEGLAKQAKMAEGLQSVLVPGLDEMVTTAQGKTDEMGIIFASLNKDATAEVAAMADEIAGHSIIPDMVDNMVSSFEEGKMSMLTVWTDTWAALIVHWDTVMPGALTRILQAFKMTYSLLIVTTGELVGNLVDSFATVPREIRAEIEDGATQFERAGKSIVEGLKKGIQDNWGAFKRWLVNLIESIVADTTDALQADSPSQVYVDIGASMVQGLRKGWEQEWGGFQSRVVGDLGRGITASTRQARRTEAVASPTAVGGDTYQFYVNDQATAGLVAAMVQDRRRARLNAGMGG